MEPQIKGPQESSTRPWTIDLRKEAHVILNNSQQLKFNISSSITPVTISKRISNVDITCNTKVQYAKFYQKVAYSPSVSTFVKTISAGHLLT